MGSYVVIDLAASIAAVALLGIWAKSATKKTTSRLPYPPGPKPLPLIGNLFDLPRGKDWLVYHDLAKTYGMFLRNRKQVFLISSCSYDVQET